jgi:enoyl-CoA hydratase/carnithine racemase
MNSRAVAVRRLGRLLELTLDTPGCEVNILGQDAAAQIIEGLESADPSAVDAVILRSAKRRSFVNGVGLMMASAARSGEDAARLSDPVRRAYRALRTYPAPTIAVIRGNCYGCGVELALHCDYRVATDTEATHFRMTEIADYLFVPAFGGTQDLPRVLGLDKAARFLLWGERWYGPEAAEHGLVDAWLDDETLDEAAVRFAHAVAIPGGKRPPGSGERREVDAVADAAHRARIAALPPMYEPLYSETYQLMVESLGRGPDDREGYARELEACGRTAVHPMAKSALSFFFVRQIALLTATRHVVLAPETHVVVAAGEDAALAAWGARLASRKIEGVTLSLGEPAADAASSAIVLAPSRTAAEGAIGVELEWSAGLPERGVPVLYAPLLGAGIRLIEIVAPRQMQGFVGQMVAVLDRAGYPAVLTHGLGCSLINMMVLAVVGPLITYVCAGGSPADAHATLRAFGYARPASDLLASIPAARRLPILRDGIPWEWHHDALMSAVDKLLATTFAGGEADVDLGEAVEASLLELATRARDDGSAPHPTALDLVAREVIDFPLKHGSLCRYLTTTRAAELVARRPRHAHLLADEGCPSSMRMAQSRRGFYRRRSGRPPVSSEGPKIG